jgi:soluble lytic murein transglycosylase-like protein
MGPSHRVRETFCAIVLGILVSFLFVQGCEAVERAACADEGPVPLHQAVRVLRPALSPEAAQGLARRIQSASEASGVDAHLLAAIAYRESNYRWSVATCRVRGARGELGLMQVMPQGYARRFAPSDCSDQCDPECSLATGARYLAHLRATCPGSTWRWVAAYGRRACPSEAEARADRATQRAAELVRLIGGTW